MPIVLRVSPNNWLSQLPLREKCRRSRARSPFLHRRRGTGLGPLRLPFPRPPETKQPKITKSQVESFFHEAARKLILLSQKISFTHKTLAKLLGIERDVKWIACNFTVTIIQNNVISKVKRNTYDVMLIYGDEARMFKNGFRILSIRTVEISIWITVHFISVSKHHSNSHASKLWT